LSFAADPGDPDPDDGTSTPLGTLARRPRESDEVSETRLNFIRVYYGLNL